jgi:hypothetical protein
MRSGTFSVDPSSRFGGDGALSIRLKGINDLGTWHLATVEIYRCPETTEGRFVFHSSSFNVHGTGPIDRLAPLLRAIDRVLEREDDAHITAPCFRRLLVTHGCTIVPMFSQPVWKD